MLVSVTTRPRGIHERALQQVRQDEGEGFSNVLMGPGDRCRLDKQRKLSFPQDDGNLAPPYIHPIARRPGFTLCPGRCLVHHGLEQGLLDPRLQLRVTTLY